MRSFRLIRRGLPAILLLAAGSLLSLRAELSEDQKKDLFRKHHQGSTSSTKSSTTATHTKSSGSSGKSKGSSSSKSKKSSSKGSSKKHSTTTTGSKTKASSSSSAKAHAGESNVPSSASHAVSKSADGPDRSAPVVSTPQSTVPEKEHPAVSVSGEPAPATLSHPPAPVPAPTTPLPLPHGATPSAPITIEKSGLETAQGLEPAPAHSGGFWSRLFGGSSRSYTYLSPSIRAAIDRAPVRRGRWKYIVVHNSGTREGNARVFDIYHKRVRHMQNGLAYHFVIGDGHGSGDGQIEIGDRWKRQINGGHVASDYLNDIALGICLVGDFNRDLPTKAQTGALEELVSYLRERVGKSQGRRAIVHAHKEINPRPTDCPGDRFPYGWLHAKFGNER